MGWKQNWKSLGVGPEWNWACMLFFNRPVYFARWDFGALHAACAVGFHSVRSCGSCTQTHTYTQPLSGPLGLSSSSTHEGQKRAISA